jgi:predicted PurR-regulated permease PerM
MSAPDRPASSRHGSWWWWVSILVVGLVLGLGSLEILGVLLRPLGLLFLAMTLAATLSPIVGRLNRHMPRVLAVILVYAALLLALGGIIGVAIPAAASQVGQLSSRLPDLIDQAQQFLAQVPGLDTATFRNALTGMIGNVGSAAVSVPAAISTSLIDAGLVVFLSLYWLILVPNINAFFFSLFPEGRRQKIRSVLADAAAAMGGYLRGASLNGLVVGILTYLGLTIIGVQYSAVLGLLAGVLELLPVVGPIVAAVIIVIVAVLQSLTKAVLSLAFMVVMQQLENHILVPNIMSSQTSISPLLTLLAVFVGSTLGGFLGALVAIPLAAALRVIVVQVIAPAVRLQTGAPEPPDEEEQAEADEEQDE